MTKLHHSRMIGKARETGVVYRGKPLCLELHEQFMYVWIKGHRDGTNIRYDSIFELGLKLDARLSQEWKRQQRGKNANVPGRPRG